MIEQYVYPLIVLSLSIFILYKTEYLKRLAQNSSDKESARDIAFEKK